MQTVEVKAMAQNAGVYMRSARSRHLRSAFTEPVNQKAPLCPVERRIIDDSVWFPSSPAALAVCRWFISPSVSSSFFFKELNVDPSDEIERRAAPPAARVKRVATGPRVKTDVQTLAVTYQKCFLIRVLYLLRNSKRNTPDYNHRNWHILLLLNPH